MLGLPLAQHTTRSEANAVISVAGSESEAVAQHDAANLNMWPSTHISAAGRQAQSLASLGATTLHTLTLTAPVEPGADLPTRLSEEAHPARAAALAGAAGCAEPLAAQMNRCAAGAAVHADLVYNTSGCPSPGTAAAGAAAEGGAVTPT